MRTPPEERSIISLINQQEELKKPVTALISNLLIRMSASTPASVSGGGGWGGGCGDLSGSGRWRQAKQEETLLDVNLEGTLAASAAEEERSVRVQLLPPAATSRKSTQLSRGVHGLACTLCLLTVIAPFQAVI